MANRSRAKCVVDALSRCSSTKGIEKEIVQRPLRETGRCQPRTFILITHDPISARKRHPKSRVFSNRWMARPFLNWERGYAVLAGSMPAPCRVGFLKNLEHWRTY